MVGSRRVLQLVAVLALAAIVVVGAILVSRDGSSDEQAATPSNPPKADDGYDGIPQTGIHLGDPEAPVTLVELADLQCPFCAQYAVTVMPSVVRDYVRTGKVRYELRFRSFLGRDSVRAAGAAAYAGKQNLMYQFADVFYRNQGPEESGYADRAFIRNIAGQVPGLDPDKTADAADDPLAWPAVRANEELARGIDSTGTPDFYVRKGRRLVQLPVEGTTPQYYARALDAALART
jgi:protein-disulfide isomerase